MLVASSAIKPFIKFLFLPRTKLAVKKIVKGAPCAMMIKNIPTGRAASFPLSVEVK